jgi:succinate dehydrogenase / fumarate reductase, cytochrome b subunit
LVGLLSSTVGKKYLMGLTALIWVGFVFAHMAGNLLIFVSADAYNSYGHALTSTKLIYIAEAILLAALIAHVFLAIQLTRINRRARPVGYNQGPGKEKTASFGSRTMAFHGTLVLVFIISHLVTFKYGTVYMTNVNGVQMRDLHRLMVEVFAQPLAVAWYSVALILLGVHLRHGVGSVFQSFGLLHPSYQATIQKLSWAYSVIVIAGFLSQPIYVFLFLKM